MQMQHRRYRYKKIREKFVRLLWWCARKAQKAMGILPTQKSLRVGGAFVLFIFICAFYRIGTIHPNFRYNPVKLKSPNKTSPRQGFLVWNEKCQIADVDPFDKSLKHLLRGAEPIICSNVAPLTYTTRVDGGRQVLRVDEGVIAQYKIKPNRLQCCYSVITRVSEDTNNMSSCSYFTKEKQLAREEEFLLVRCVDKITKDKVYTNMHAVVQVKSPPSKASSSSTSPPEEGSTTNTTPRRLSVLLLGIDSMSRLNMRRTMPRTVSYLQANKWLELRGYNKIADNTYPNLMAILTGLDREQLTHAKCWPSKKGSLDHCPIIWREFKQKGYVTAYAEDEPHMATFNFHNEGFVVSPTDYYFRPYMLAATRRLPIKKRDGHKVCLGPTPTTDHFLRFTMDVATTFNSALYFAMIWLNNFSHNNHNTPAALDNRFNDFFHELEMTGTFNNTLIVFLSDHGARFGDIRKTYVGWLEERLPFIYLWVPKWFKESYPDYYSNLQDNGDRLTSPYDLHLTLKDVVAGLESVGTSTNGSGGCPSCASLFTSIPQVRGCRDAGVTPHWCTCATQTNMSLDEDVVKEGTQFVIDEIQTKLSHAGNASEKCAKLRLNKILEARWKIQNEEFNVFEDYIVVFKTEPGSAQFDATVRHWHKSKPPKFEVMGTISRIDSYESHSTCIQNAELKLYCTCID